MNTSTPYNPILKNGVIEWTDENGGKTTVRKDAEGGILIEQGGNAIYIYNHEEKQTLINSIKAL